jgi:hypothetical protein
MPRMRRLALHSGLAGLAGMLLVSMRAHAGLTITTQRGNDPVATLYVEGDHFKAEEPKKAEATAVIVDAKAKKVIMIDATKRTYTEMTEEDRKRMRGQMDAMRAQMQERMKNMPPDQRAKIESMMGPPGAADAGKPHDWKFESTGQKKTINGFACDMYRVSEDGQLHEEQCVSPWSAGLVKKSDFAGIQQFAESMMDDFGGRRGRSGSIFSRIEKAPGIPISRVPIDANGQRGPEEQIKSIKRGPVPASVFEIPAGFTKREMPMGGPGMGAHHHGGPPGP